MTACHCSGFMRMMSVSRVMPALLTRMSTVPHLSTASLISLRAGYSWLGTPTTPGLSMTQLPLSSAVMLLPTLNALSNNGGGSMHPAQCSLSSDSTLQSSVQALLGLYLSMSSRLERSAPTTIASPPASLIDFATSSAAPADEA